MSTFRPLQFALTLVLASAGFSASAESVNPKDDSTVTLNEVAENKHRADEIAFVDMQLVEHEKLISFIRDGIEVIVLDAEQNSVRQITSVLQQKRKLSAVHIITHGRDGEILFAGD